MGNTHKKRKKVPRLVVKAIEEPGVTVLLLGQGRSGRSTIARQLQEKYVKPENRAPWHEDGVRWRTAVFRTVVESMVEVIKVHENHTTFSDPALREARDLVIARYESYQGRDYSVMNENIKDALVTLWNDEGFRGTYEVTDTYYVNKNLEYYMNNAERILRADAEMNEMDRLCAHMRTTGINQIKFELDGVNFSFMDVGGARNERRKWMHVFENITTIVFVSAISEYNEVLFEDPSVNSLQESLTLFDHPVNAQVFAELPLIVYMNKSDVFQRKIRRVPIKYIHPSNPKLSRWEDFNGPSAVGLDAGSAEFAEAHEAATEYFEDKFRAVCKNSSGRELIIRVVCALDDTFTGELIQRCHQSMSKDLLKEQTLLADYP